MFLKLFFYYLKYCGVIHLLITDRYMLYKCPDGFTYGSECSLGCKGKFPLVGNETIVCEKNSTSVSTKGYWEKGDIEPFCKCKIYKIYACLNFFLVTF